jgi:3-oxoacyl-[acyl-carrier protein] reductase
VPHTAPPADRPADPADRSARPAEAADGSGRSAGPAGSPDRSSAPAGRSARCAEAADGSGRPAGSAGQAGRSTEPADRSERSGEPGHRPTVLVTGSSSGIGRAVALRFARAGYDVTINYSRSKDRAERTLEELRAFGGEHRAVCADVADDDAVRALVARAVEATGRLDVLVNNAGTTSATPPADLDGIDLADWDRVMATNVRGLVQVTRAAAPALRRAGGAVVNVASIVGLRPGPQPLVYAASKAAVVNLTRTLSAVLAPEVRVNAVAPGWIAGEWMRRTLGDAYDDLMARRARRTPLGRNVTEEDVAESVYALAVSHPFVTGEVVVIDGGYTATT